MPVSRRFTNDGALVMTDTTPQTHDTPWYLGFSGGGFDEIRIRDGEVGTVTGFYDGTDNALAIDAIETAVPEPTCISLLALGTIALVRRRR